MLALAGPDDSTHPETSEKGIYPEYSQITLMRKNRVITQKNKTALIRMALTPISVISASPVAMGIMMATAAREAMSSRITDVIMPVEAPDLCKFSLFSIPWSKKPQ